MCGIVGFASISAAPTDWLQTGRDALQHRGPDDAGLWLSPDARVGLAHRRLAIIDLSPGGHQPMLDAGGTCAIVYNGEIYNYRELKAELAAKGHSFRTQSDTEVVLAAYREWGSDCLARLNGMFALALYDTARKQLLLARDRAGEKPLFYRLDRGQLRFASELKALLADPAAPRRIDPTALDCYLAIGYVPGERCLLEGYNKLPPAHAMLFDCATGAAKVWRYWDLPVLHPASGSGELDETALLDEFEALLADAVGHQLVADVPVGILLSGGVDSSLITAMATRASSRVKTFTVGFAGFERYDESAHARLVADHFGTEHIELQAGDADASLLPMLARQYDEPIIDSSMIPTYLVSQLVRQHCTVALGGDGGDELFGGYPHYSRLALARQRLGWIPRPVRRAAAGLGGYLLPVGFKGRNWLQALGADWNGGLPLVAAHFDQRSRLALLGGSRGASNTAEQIMAQRSSRARDLVDRATRTDFSNYMSEDILVKVDRASMLSSLELRAPLLDYRIVEFAFGRVPTHLKATTLDRKILLKRLAERVLPPAFDRKRKQGFSVPLASWLKQGSWRELFHSVLGDPNGLFQRSATQGLLQGQDAGRQNYERLFGLVLFELWRREYRCTI
jgi:asparagine synthase (glutamine-hydrolysing)